MAVGQHQVGADDVGLQGPGGSACSGPGSVDSSRSTLLGIRAGEDTGNARFARTLFEQTLNRQALRPTRGGKAAGLGRGEVMTLTADDVAKAARSLLGEPTSAPELSRWQGWMG